jgi:hypothetical protein
MTEPQSKPDAEVCGYCGRRESEEPRQRCLDGCEMYFDCEAEADAHAALTGHMTGWPVRSA